MNDDLKRQRFAAAYEGKPPWERQVMLEGKHIPTVVPGHAYRCNDTGAWEIGAMPTFDGMAAAGGRLYLSAQNGALLCFEGR